METIGSAHLEFNQLLNNLKGKKLTAGLSAVALTGKTLWVANDETISLERLFFKGRKLDGHFEYADHTSFQLKDFLILPEPPDSVDLNFDFEEADIEGLDCHNGYLWLICSHSLKRKKAESKSQKKNFDNIATISSDGNRYLLARIPLAEDDEQGGPGEGFFTLKKEISQQNGDTRTAAQLPGDTKKSSLTKLLKEDRHLQMFLEIPGKDNGLDIEGIAVSGNRVFIGLRGPVLRGWAIILELKVEVDDVPFLLELRSFDPLTLIDSEHPKYRKHFLELGGLGIRDLCIQDKDLLILAGPTMVLDGPVKIFRWTNAVQIEQESIVFKNALIEVRDLPFGNGEEHPEGMGLFLLDGLSTNVVLVVNDAVSNSLDGSSLGENGFKANLFSLNG